MLSHYLPSESSENTGSHFHSPVKATLKWFNKTKGFGFVIPLNQPDLDAFLHITTLYEAQCPEIGPGAELLCQLKKGDKGLSVEKIIEVITIGDEASPELSASQGTHDQCAQENNRGTANPAVDKNSADGACDTSPSSDFAGYLEEVEGEVKWYIAEKGYGFITPDQGGKDIFIHRHCLERNGIDKLSGGQRMKMRVRNANKGKEVVHFTLKE